MIPPAQPIFHIETIILLISKTTNSNSKPTEPSKKIIRFYFNVVIMFQLKVSDRSFQLLHFRFSHSHSFFSFHLLSVCSSLSSLSHFTLQKSFCLYFLFLCLSFCSLVFFIIKRSSFFFSFSE